MAEEHNPDNFPVMTAHDSTERKKHDQILSEYTYTVSHSLNAPLRHIIQYGELLKKEAGDRLGINETMYVNQLIINTKKMLRLIKDLLSYAKIIHIQEEKQKLDINKTIAEVMENMAPIIKESHATINISNLPTLPVYPFRMGQILQNLMANAIKYRSLKDLVVSIKCDDKSAYYLFSVQDNGIGIPKKYHEIIFKALKRLHSEDEIEGSGLGLAICEKAVEAHGGRIWVESNPGEGSIFFFTIPKLPSESFKNPESRIV